MQMHVLYGEGSLIVQSGDVLRIDDDNAVHRTVDDIAIRHVSRGMLYIFGVETVAVAHVDDLGRTVGIHEYETFLCGNPYPSGKVFGDAHHDIGRHTLVGAELMRYLVCLQVEDIHASAVGGNP